MKKILFCCCFISLQAFAQQSDKATRKAMELLESSMTAMRSYEYPEAIRFLQEAIKVKPNFPDAYGQMGLTYLAMKQYTNAEQAFQKLGELDPAGLKTVASSYARAKAGNGKFTEALAILTENELTAKNISPKTKQLKKDMEFAVTTKPVPFQPQNLGESVNTPDPEYFPHPRSMAKRVFTRRVNGRNEDFFIAGRDSLQWIHAKDMGEPVNTAFNEGAQNISQDGEMLVYTGCDFPNGRGSCDIYFSLRTPEGGWTQPKNIGPAINTEVWESQPCLSPDKQTLFFVRATPDAGSDIFVSTRNAAGQWTPAERLGPHINTKGRETTPYLHADGQTLFFASDGHPGFGGSTFLYPQTA